MKLRRFLDQLGSWAGPLGVRRAHPGNTLTIISVVYSTEAKTFTGPAVYVTQVGAPVVASPTKSDPATPDPQPTQSSAPSSTEQDDTETASAAPSTTSDSQPTSSSSSMSLTPTPSTTAAPLTSHLASTPSAGAVSSTSASPTAAPASGGMSGGAKAGLAFGLILGLAFVGFGVFYLYRKQRQKHEAHQRLDDEKMAMTHSDVLPRHPEPEMTATAALAQPAPHLSLRPVTQFNPTLAENQNTTPGGMPAPTSVSNLTPDAVAAPPTPAKGNTGLRQPGASAWEQPGSRNAANDPANPFGNHAETITSRPSTAQSPAQAPTQPVVAPAAASAPAPATPAAAPAPARVPSPQNVNPADFPLPSSAPVSPNAPSFDPNVTGQPTSSDGPSSTATGAAAGAVAGAAVATAAAAAAASKNSSPKKPAPASGPVHRVQMDFIPSMDDELEIHSGQLLRIKHEYDDGWALCEFLDGSKSGVVPRSCLSKAPLKPRPTNGPSPNRPPIRGAPPPGAIPRPLTPGGGRNSPVPGVQVPRPLTPTGRNSPAPYAQSPRSMSPARPRGRANSNASPYIAYQPQGRSMSPGPYGAGQLKPTPRPDVQRRRSKSVSQLSDASSSAIPAPLQTVARKPVGGHKPSGSN